MHLGSEGIYGMLHIVEGDIGDKAVLEKEKIDAVVNAANPTLMGSNQGVDGAIHTVVNSFLPRGELFRDKICEELHTPREENIIRCRRGQAVLTSGYGLCRYVIHVVGAQYDGGKGRWKCCSGTVVKILESCYNEIVKLLKEHTDIKRIAVPVISSGEYGFPFREAVKIAIAAVGNALIDWRTQDPEMFELSGIEEIYFFIGDKDPKVRAEHKSAADAILKKYEKSFRTNCRVVFQSSLKAHFHYMKDIVSYDEQKGYFSVAKVIRLLLMAVRLLFFPVMLFKDLIGGTDWKKRRQFVEIFTLIKAVIPVMIWMVMCLWGTLTDLTAFRGIVLAVSVYGMSDTITYLLTLIMLADIQRPSANIIRSMILLLVNYVEVSLEMALVYFTYYRGIIRFREAAAFGILGINSIKPDAVGDYIFVYLNAGIKFFFVSLVFGYFANHLRQRKFRG